MQTDILLKRLHDFEFLHGLDHVPLAALAKSVTWKVFPPNAVVFWEGATESNLYYLQYGSLKALRTAPDGREQVLRFLEAGEIFNEIGVLGLESAWMLTLILLVYALGFFILAIWWLSKMDV
jgi:CRP-like cAMP-binding protein